MPGSLAGDRRATIDPMVHLLLLLLGALVVGVIAYGVTWVVTGRDGGLDPEEPDGRAVPLPGSRPLTESDIQTVRFDTTLRGYRMDQVDAALRRSAYDLGYKEELIEVLEAELDALRAGRTSEADQLRAARERAQAVSTAAASKPASGTDEPATDDAAPADDATTTDGATTPRGTAADGTAAAADGAAADGAATEGDTAGAATDSPAAADARPTDGVPEADGVDAPTAEATTGR